MPWSEHALTILIGLTGALIGGLVGSLASPASSKENKQFKQYALVLVTFLGGYSLEKISRLLGADAASIRDLLHQPVPFGRLLLFVCTAISSGIIFWVFRTYAMEPEPSAEDKYAELLLPILMYRPAPGAEERDEKFYRSVAKLIANGVPEAPPVVLDTELGRLRESGAPKGDSGQSKLKKTS